MLLSDRAAARGWLRPAAVRTLIDEHAAAAWDHAARLWCLLMLELWARTYLDAATPPAAPADRWEDL